MSLEFEDSYNDPYNMSKRKQTYTQGPKGLVKLVLKARLASTEAGANKLLLIIAIVFFIITAIGITWYAVAHHSPARAPYHFSNDLVKKLPAQAKQNILAK